MPRDAFLSLRFQEPHHWGDECPWRNADHANAVLLEVAGHREGHTDECTLGGGIRNLTGLTFKLHIWLTRGRKERPRGIATHSGRTRYHDHYTPLAIWAFWRDRDKVLASDSREVERPRQIDVHDKVPHINRMRLSIGAYELHGHLASIDETKCLAHLCRCPNTSTVDDAPQERTSLFRPRNDLLNHLDDIFDLRDIQLVKFNLVRCRSNGSCVSLL